MSKKQRIYMEKGRDKIHGYKYGTYTTLQTQA